ncbi:MAG: amino acid adenylation domain-containing protein [Treponema sp.]|nr:amino acid adenylation domain-containing protein [Treponema sp.]
MKYTVLDYLEATSEKYADKTAFADVQESVNWKDFVKDAKAISSFLEKYFDPRTAVPLVTEKSVLTLKLFFAALYAGCFYSFVDATFPDERLLSMISTLKAKTLVVDRKFQKKIEGLGSDCKIIYTDDLLKEVKEANVPYNPARRNQIVDVDPVYANFTSGTTGMPKAVLVNHRNVVDFISCFTEVFDIQSSENLANQAPFDFDVSVKDIFTAVFTGAAVHLVPKAFFSFPTKLLDYLEEREITTIIWAVSAMCIISTLGGFKYKKPLTLKKIMFSGEVMPVKQLRIWKENVPDAKYINLYGPTEITCNCTYAEVPQSIGEDYVLPIGIPFPNERVFLLDENDALITEAEKTGELCVSGSCVAPGYYNNGERTAQAFVQNPLNPSYFERIYRTGDLASYGKDGLLYYVSRKDTQIKHMGHRIELSEIEGAVEKICSITRACCIFAQNKISAFYTGQETDKKEIVTALKTSLPVYMIPSNFIFIEEFPLTKNGKVDKRALEAKLNG